jgi:hypothetical protein
MKAALTYPFWLSAGSPAPDNHFRKRSRIVTLCRDYSCDTFIETGTFYGQMVNVARKHFKKVMSVELLRQLYELNRSAFASHSNVTIFHGDSATQLAEMLAAAQGRILFWLDGHYSGNGTACGEEVSPVLAELDTIKTHSGRDHCILIDDVRLFTGSSGYPTLEQTKQKLRAINCQYQISIDGDCLKALP